MILSVKPVSDLIEALDDEVPAGFHDYLTVEDMLKMVCHDDLLEAELKRLNNHRESNLSIDDLLIIISAAMWMHACW